jgi:hypothetical protein
VSLALNEFVRRREEEEITCKLNEAYKDFPPDEEDKENDDDELGENKIDKVDEIDEYENLSPEDYDEKIQQYINGIKKKIVSDLLSEAKEDAFEEIQNSIFKPSKSKLLKAENRKKAISDKVSNIAAKFKKK